MFNPSNFIQSYVSTDIIISIKDNSGNVLTNFTVGHVQKIARDRACIGIELKDETIINLVFSTEADAKVAIISLNTAVETLFPNYRTKFGNTVSVANPIVTVPASAATYTSLANTNNLIPHQTYELTDTFNLYGFGTNTVINVTPRTSDDKIAYGRVQGTNKIVAINIDTNEKIFLHDDDDKIFTAGNSNVTISGGSQRLEILGKSTLNAINSFDIRVGGNSVAQCENCNNVEIRGGSNLFLKGATNSRFDGIVGNFYTFDGLFSDIYVSSNTDGKRKRETINLTDNELIYAYVAGNELVVPSLTGNINKKYENPFGVQANARFSIHIPLGVMGDYILNIRDSSNNLILPITSAYEGSRVEIYYNKTSGLFELVSREQLFFKKQAITAGFTGQTTFTDVLPIKTLTPSESILTINGVRAIYGVSEEYTISGRTLVWNNTNYELEPSDHIELYFI